jgi:thiol-disulfide isomerase/thioredoxin
LENRPNYRKLIRYLLFAAAVVWIAIGVESWSDQKAGVRAVKDRTPMADLAFPQFDGASWRLSDHRGQVVLINYWASWCAPCRQETPGLINLARDYRYKGLSIVGVSMDGVDQSAEGGKRAVESFLSEFHMPYPVLMPISRRRRRLPSMRFPPPCWSIETAVRPRLTSAPCGSPFSAPTWTGYCANRPRCPRM